MVVMGLLCCVLSLGAHLVVRLRFFEVSAIDDIEYVPCDPPKSVSLVVAARNEEATIVPALERLLDWPDPDRDVVVVEDRSEDRTRELVASLSAEHEELTLVPIDELPEGWLGKIHALHQGAQAATGEWLLFSDADVHIDGEFLRHTVNVCEARQLDHLAVLPRFECRSFLTRCTIAAFCGALMSATSRKRRQDSHANDHAIGVGAFNLVRRRVFEQSEGFAWLKMDVADDMALALVMKRAGARHDVMFARQGLQVEWYATLPDMVHGLEKNAFGAGCHYSVWRSLAVVVGLLVSSVGPLLALSHWPILVVLTYALGGLSAYTVYRRTGQKGLAPFFVPVGSVLMAWIVFNATCKALWRGGIEWRGTTYSLAALRKQQRFGL